MSLKLLTSNRLIALLILLTAHECDDTDSMPDGLVIDLAVSPALGGEKGFASSDDSDSGCSVCSGNLPTAEGQVCPSEVKPEGMGMPDEKVIFDVKVEGAENLHYISERESAERMEATDEGVMDLSSVGSVHKCQTKPVGGDPLHPSNFGSADLLVRATCPPELDPRSGLATEPRLEILERHEEGVQTPTNTAGNPGDRKELRDSAAPGIIDLSRTIERGQAPQTIDTIRENDLLQEAAPVVFNTAPSADVLQTASLNLHLSQNFQIVQDLKTTPGSTAYPLERFPSSSRSFPHGQTRAPQSPFVQSTPENCIFMVIEDKIVPVKLDALHAGPIALVGDSSALSAPCHQPSAPSSSFQLPLKLPQSLETAPSFQTTFAQKHQSSRDNFIAGLEVALKVFDGSTDVTLQAIEDGAHALNDILDKMKLLLKGHSEFQAKNLPGVHFSPQAGLQKAESLPWRDPLAKFLHKSNSLRQMDASSEEQPIDLSQRMNNSSSSNPGSWSSNPPPAHCDGEVIFLRDEDGRLVWFLKKPSSLKELGSEANINTSINSPVQQWNPTSKERALLNYLEKFTVPVCKTESPTVSFVMPPVGCPAGLLSIRDVPKSVMESIGEDAVPQNIPGSLLVSNDIAPNVSGLEVCVVN